MGLPRAVRWISGLSLAALFGGVAGFYICSQQIFQGLEVQRLESAGMLTWQVVALTRYRTGDVEGGVGMIEQAVDDAIVSLPRGLTSLPVEVETPLRYAKLYRSVVPPRDEEDEEVLQVLSLVDMPDPSKCQSDVQEAFERLLDSKEPGAGQQWRRGRE